ncbi:MAG: DUF885 domain-containing protein [Alphaproteobacteria bacterium]|nr:DUF885 domain-containing protein [Alphaproteobacteria bacterium]
MQSAGQLPAESSVPDQAGEEGRPPLRLVDIEVEDDGDEEDQAAGGVDPGTGEAGGDEAGLDHRDDEGAEDRADDGRAPAEDGGAADQHRGDADEQVALALVAEIVLVLECEEDGGDGREEAHQGEELDLLAIDIDADDPCHRVGIADEQGVLAEAVTVEDEPHDHDDDQRPEGLDRDLGHPVDAGGSKGPADQHRPDRALLGAAERVGAAAREHCRHAVPEELRAERGDEGRDADLGDEHAVDEADDDAGKEKLIADLNVKVRTVRAMLPKYFRTLPRADVVIKRVPKYIEEGQAGGYYNSPSLDGSRPGIYYINLRNTAEVPSWTLPTLTYHEAIPGHHLQGAIQQEVNLPLIRKVSFFSAYAEGWALYAEELADEMGLYKNDPFGRIGYLHDAMFRAVRLVVDTGIHAMHWSRDKAIAYYVGAIGDPVPAATTEVERYCVWPGQACSYMLGKLAILRLREKAKRDLGAKFDLRDFHEAILRAGAVPLHVLDTVIDGYIRKARG